MNSRLMLLTPLFAVATVPVGILAGLYAGLVPAITVFIVGWLLLVPVSAILFGGELITGSMSTEFEQIAKEEMGGPVESGDELSTDPVEELRQRYARGEINDRELEQGLEALLETEGVDPQDTQEIEDTIDRLDDIESNDELLTEDG